MWWAKIGKYGPISLGYQDLNMWWDCLSVYVCLQQLTADSKGYVISKSMKVKPNWLRVL